MASGTTQGRLKGKRCVVTGAAQGIALAATQAFLREGAEVMAVDVNEAMLMKMPQHPGLLRRVLDVRDRDAIFELAKDYKGVNVLFNCAGYVHSGTIMDCSVEDWDKSFDVNIKSMFHFIQAFLPQMQSGGGGSVINMSSVLSSVMGIRMRGVYGASKAAVVGLTKGLAAEHVRENIRVNVVCPGPVETDAYVSRTGDVRDVDSALQAGVLGPTKNMEVRARVTDRLMGHLPTPEDLTGLFTYLASDESWNQTGTVLVSDGGFSSTF